MLKSLFSGERKPELNKRKRVILQAFLVAGVLIALFMSLWLLAAPSHQPHILISEVMASNRETIADEDGDFSDFIELYNAGLGSVNLSGWYLSDGDLQPLRWMLPDIVLEPGEYVLFFASGKNKQQADGIWHTSFSVSSDGSEPVLLSMPDGSLHDRIPPVKYAADVSFGLSECMTFHAYMTSPTPGMANNDPYYMTLEELAPPYELLIISEYMTSNDCFFPDENGFYHSWVELHNLGSETVELVGWYLSDNVNNPRKWSFPEGTGIPPGGFLVLHCSGLDLPGHVPFRLSASDIMLTLSDQYARFIDSIPLYTTPLYASYGRTDDGSEGFFAIPTPGEQNLGHPVSSPDDLIWEPPALLIMEYMSSNNHYFQDIDGDFNDWVEILNNGDDTLELHGLFLSDRSDRLNKWGFPEGMLLQPGQRVVIHLSGKDLPGHANFSLSEDDDGIFISDRFGRLIDSVGIIRTPSHVSVGRNEEDHSVWLFFPRATPGLANDTIGFTDLAGLTTAELGRLYISEVSLDNWVVIANASSEALSMSGWGLTDSSYDLHREILPDTTLMPGETLRFDLNSINITQRGQTLLLTDDEGFPADSFSTGSLRQGVTAVRLEYGSEQYGSGEHGSGQRGLSFGGEIYDGYAHVVNVDVDDLLVEPGTLISLYTNDPGAVIRYTTDGSIPTDSSPIYTKPIEIVTNTVVRAINFTPGMIPSPALGRTYLVDASHDIPVVTLISDPAGLFSASTGIFANGFGWTEGHPNFGANFWQQWTREAHFAFYEGADLRVESRVDMRVHGNWSRAYPQKSLAIHFSGSRHGLSQLAYPLIPDIDRTLYDSLILRTSGQDWQYAKLRDAVIHRSVLGVTNIVGMAATPVVVYINGEYWGLYNLREKINSDYFAINEGIPNDEIDIIRGNRRVVAGSSDDYFAMVNRLRFMSMNTDAAFDFVDASIDLDNWIDYWIVVTYFGNLDTSNIKWYRHHDGKWRWILFDQDWGLALRMPYRNPFANMLDARGHSFGLFCSVIARSLMRNDVIRNRFLERYAELMQTVLDADRLIGILDDYAAQIESEMPQNIARWRKPSSMDAWHAELDLIRTFISQRESQIKGFMRYSFNLSPERITELFP
ncbi:MAG: lamin tail domain-containing protein [Oscillospiraceae bacterium]|jgi:hypothetical protein|nr:lamin tail domain-containing protein [Oscillospiraceae bacterium]